MTPLCLASLLVLSAGAPPDAAPAGAPSAPVAAASAQELAPASRLAPASALAPTPAAATASTAAPPAAGTATGASTPAPPGPYNAPAEGPDVELHVPKAEVQKLSLDVENLQARLDVDTSVAQLVTIRAGVVATVQKLKAELDGVQAETHLVVRLNRVAEIMNRALAAIDDKPQLAGNAPVTPAQAGATVPAAGVAADAAVVPSPTANPNPAPAPTKPPTE
jgi:hypothetical protein